MNPKIVVILSVQWGIPGDVPSRWFFINPRNTSGARLIKIIGHRRFYVTNACSELVHSASDKGTPDSEWLRANLKVLQPDVVLVCGAVARATFARDMVTTPHVVTLPHPAARMWSARALADARRKVARACKAADAVMPRRSVASA